MLARDQSRIPPGRSIRLTSSAVNGACFARHAQKSFANCSRESGCAWTAVESVSEVSSKSGARTRTHSKSLRERKQSRCISREALSECDACSHRFSLSSACSDSVFTPSFGVIRWQMLIKCTLTSAMAVEVCLGARHRDIPARCKCARPSLFLRQRFRPNNNSFATGLNSPR